MNSEKRKALQALLKKKKGMKKSSKKKSGKDFVTLITDFVSKNEKKVFFGIVVLVIAAGVIYYFVRKNKSGDSSSTTPTPTPSTVAPTITSSALSTDNKSLEVTFSKPVYGSKSGSDLEQTDFKFSLSGNNTELSVSPTPTSIRISNDKKTFTLGIELNGTPDGTEKLTVTPVENSIFDAAGNAASTSQSNNEVTLNDEKKPTMTITSTTVLTGRSTNNSDVSLTFTSSEKTTNFGSGDITVSGGRLDNFDGSGKEYTATLTELQENEAYSVKVAANTFTDAAGNQNNASNTFTFTYDTTPPSLTMTTATTQTTTKPTITGTTEAGCTVTVKYNNKVVGKPNVDDVGSFSFTSTTSYDNGGPYIFTVTSTDEAGNTDSKDVEITIDTSLPSLRITSATTQNNSKPTITGTTDAGCTVTLMKDSDSLGSETTDSGDFSITSTTDYSDGKHTFIVTSKNPDTDKTNSKEVQITIDTTAPTITITSATTQNNSNPTITGTTDAGCTVTLMKDGDSLGSTTAEDSGNFSITSSANLSDGDHTLTVTSKDTAGNTESKTVQITIDTTKPTIQSTSLVNNNNNNMTVTFSEEVYNNNSENRDLTKDNFKFTLSGGSATLDSSNPSNVSSTDNKTFTLGISLSGTPDGTEQLTVEPVKNSIVDAAGNTASTTQSNNVVTLIDSKNPTIEISASNLGYDDYTNKDVDLIFTCSEALSNFSTDKITLTKYGNEITGSYSDIASSTVGSKTLYKTTLTVSENATYTVSVEEGVCTDAVGNTNTESNTFTFTYDTKKPEITITSQTVESGYYTNQNTVQLTFTCSEALSNFSTNKITLTKDGNEITGSYSDIEPSTVGSKTLYKTTLNVDGDDTYTVSVEEGVCTDAVGNTNTESNTFTFTYDTKNPIMTITSQTVSNGGSTNNSKILLTFVSTEKTKDFKVDDITVSGSSSVLSNFTGSGTEYTATLTVSEKGKYKVSVEANKFEDSAGNKNNPSTFSFTYNPFQQNPNWFIVAYSVLALTLGGGIGLGLLYPNKPVYRCGGKKEHKHNNNRYITNQFVTQNKN